MMRFMSHTIWFTKGLYKVSSYSIGVLGYSMDLSTIVLALVFLSERSSPFPCSVT
jgi:hypothetical protein